MYALLIEVLEIQGREWDDLHTDGAPGRTRTDTGRILSPLSLPLDYGGHEQVLRQFT